MAAYNTNLAGEFYVLSMLYRLGADAMLTLGNKKSVDIAIVRSPSDAITVDVKALAGKTGWPVDNFREREGHFLALICFLGQIEKPTVAPEIYILPSTEVRNITYFAPGGRKVIQLSRVRRDGKKYLDAWTQLLPKGE